MGRRLQLLLERINESKDADSHFAFLEDVQYAYGIKHVAYLGLNIPNAAGEEPIALNTYGLDWGARYRAQNYVAIDPVIHEGLTRTIPISWNELPKRSSDVKRFFEDARKFGVGNNGFSVPIHGLNSERAAFSISSDETDRNWNAYLNEVLPELQVIGHYFHHMLSTAHGAEKRAVSLSPREREVLLWSANGKTSEDIAVILNLSSNTVRRYIDTARHKLNALNVAHAVARAIHSGIIPPPDC